MFCFSGTKIIWVQIILTRNSAFSWKSFEFYVYCPFKLSPKITIRWLCVQHQYKLLMFCVGRKVLTSTQGQRKAKVSVRCPIKVFWRWNFLYTPCSNKTSNKIMLTSSTEAVKCSSISSSCSSKSKNSVHSRDHVTSLFNLRWMPIVSPFEVCRAS